MLREFLLQAVAPVPGWRQRLVRTGCCLQCIRWLWLFPIRHCLPLFTTSTSHVSHPYRVHCSRWGCEAANRSLVDDCAGLHYGPRGAGEAPRSQADWPLEGVRTPSTSLC